MDEIRSEYRVARIKKALRENYRAGKIADNIDLLNDELRYFPEKPCTAGTRHLVEVGGMESPASTYIKDK